MMLKSFDSIADIAAANIRDSLFARGGVVICSVSDDGGRFTIQHAGKIRSEGFAYMALVLLRQAQRGHSLQTLMGDARLDTSFRTALAGIINHLEFYYAGPHAGSKRMRARRPVRQPRRAAA